MNSIAQELMRENLDSVHSGLKGIIERTNQVQQDLGQEYTCENTKLLEVIMEHLFFHWEDITELLIDDLLEEEVHERNRLEELAARSIDLLEDDEEDDSFS